MFAKLGKFLFESKIKKFKLKYKYHLANTRLKRGFYLKYISRRQLFEFKVENFSTEKKPKKNHNRYFFLAEPDSSIGIQPTEFQQSSPVVSHYF